MPADPFTLRQADQARTDFAIIEAEIEAIRARPARLPTRQEIARNTLIAMLGFNGESVRLDGAIRMAPR
jgi:hypothetical protein